MKRAIARVFLVFAVVSIATIAAFPQNGTKAIPAADKYLISAKAGKINFTEGTVNVTRAVGRSGVLVMGDQLQAGDKVATEAFARAEVLLNPGSYLRMGGLSEFSFRTTSLDDLRLDIHSGSAILEVFASNQFRVSAYTPKGRVTIVNSGVYRIDVEPNGDALLSVIEGRALIGEKTIALIKEGQTGTINGGAIAIGKFDRDKRDALASWSRTRSKDLAKMTAAFNNKNSRPLLVSSMLDSFTAGNWGNWNNRGTLGVWLYDPISRTCIFMPFYSNWSTPYGYSYHGCACIHYLPSYVQPVVVLPTRLDGRYEPPSDSEAESKTRPSRPSYSEPKYDVSRDSKSMPSYSPPSMMKSEPVYNPPPPPVTKDKPIND